MRGLITGISRFIYLIINIIYIKYCICTVYVLYMYCICTVYVLYITCKLYLHQSQNRGSVHKMVEYYTVHRDK